jgi:hypothetical protein
MKKKKNIKPFTARVPEELLDWLDQYAKEHRWSRNTTVIAIFEKKKEEEKEPAHEA